jgi:hypothetical protein
VMLSFERSDFGFKFPATLSQSPPPKILLPFENDSIFSSMT